MPLRSPPRPVRCWPPRLAGAAARHLFARYGEMPHQHPAVLGARLALVTGDEHAVYVWPPERPRCLLAFRRNGDIWQSVFPGAPVLADGTLDGDAIAGVCSGIAADLGAEALYFPLAYPGTAAARTLAGAPGMVRWSRSPSPVVHWGDRGAGVMARFRQRHGSQADRKLRRWRDALTAGVLDPLPAQHVLTQVEQCSWKATAGLDLASAGQLAYYHRLLHTGAAVLTAAFSGGEPVAYRLDLRHGRTVYAVEWSFVRDAARLTPGVFLLTAGLVHRWAGEELDQVDLFGAPDRLKTLVETGRRERVDFAWPAGPALDRLRAGRQEHDAHLRRQFARGVGIRRTYDGG
ncbi:MAG TPA: GNAT family N-acetyltransferase [Micromonosporaceae bacterium]|nr:GNAT family N-acetyltransferase [Micromonosporaceae bacterium]